MRCLLLALVIVGLAASEPERWAVVVNRHSWASWSVGLAWAQQRGIPDSHVIVLDEVSEWERLPVAEAQRRILDPIRQTLARRALQDTVWGIAYAPDLPTQIELPADLARERIVGRHASLTGWTFLAGHHDDLRALVAPAANPYARTAQRPGRAADRMANAHPQARRADDLAEAKDWRGARAAVLQALAVHDDSPGLWYNLACYQARLGERAAALAALVVAVERGWSDRAWMRQDQDLASLREDPAFAQACDRAAAWPWGVEPTAAFSPMRDDHRGLLLAAMLPPMGGRALGLADALACLARAAGADGTHPAGIVALMRNSDVRSRTRQWAFDRLVQLQTAPAATVIDGDLPHGRADLAGAVLGTAMLRFHNDDPPFLPGAFAEHLTSFGGILAPGASQTPCTELLRRGAAGSCGTVAEPYAVQWKFPEPFLHWHYAHGATLAEAFYQSVAGPYQLLLVGDPLCAPWRTTTALPLVCDPGWPERPVLVRAEAPAATWTWFLDGVALPATGDTCVLDPRQMAAGRHQLTAVGTLGLAQRWRGQLQLDLPGAEPPACAPVTAVWGEPATLRLAAPGLRTAIARLAGAELARGRGQEAIELALPTAGLGLGELPIRIQLLGDGGADLGVARCQLTLSAPEAGAPAATADGEPGLRDAAGTSITKLPGAAGATLSGWLPVARDGIGQFQVRGAAELTIDDTPVRLGGSGPWRSGPLRVAAGWHRLTIRYPAGSEPGEVRWGVDSCLTLDPVALRADFRKG